MTFTMIDKDERKNMRNFNGSIHYEVMLVEQDPHLGLKEQIIFVSKHIS